MDDMPCFQRVEINLALDDARGAGLRTNFSLVDVDDDQESLYQQRAKAWFPFGLTLSVSGVQLPQKVQVGDTAGMRFFFAVLSPRF